MKLGYTLVLTLLASTLVGIVSSSALSPIGHESMRYAYGNGAVVIDYGPQNNGWSDDSEKEWTDCSNSNSGACDSEDTLILGSHDYDDGWVSAARTFGFYGKSGCYSHAQIEMEVQTNGPNGAPEPGWVGSSKVTEGEGGANKLMFYAWDYQGGTWDLINANTKYQFHNGNYGTIQTQDDGREFRTVMMTIPLSGEVPLTARDGAYTNTFAEDMEFKHSSMEFEMQIRVLNHPAEDDWGDDDLRTEIKSMSVQLTPLPWIQSDLLMTTGDGALITPTTYTSSKELELYSHSSTRDSCLFTNPLTVEISGNEQSFSQVLYEPTIDLSEYSMFAGELNLTFERGQDEFIQTSLLVDQIPPEGNLSSVHFTWTGMNISLDGLYDEGAGFRNSHEIVFNLDAKSVNGREVTLQTSRRWDGNGLQGIADFTNLFANEISTLLCDEMTIEVKILDLAEPPNEHSIQHSFHPSCPSDSRVIFSAYQINADESPTLRVFFIPNDQLNTSGSWECGMRINESKWIVLPTKELCHLGGQLDLPLNDLGVFDSIFTISVGVCYETTWENSVIICEDFAQESTQIMHIDRDAPVVFYEMGTIDGDRTLILKANDSSGIAILKLLAVHEDTTQTEYACKLSGLTAQTCNPFLLEGINQDGETTQFTNLTLKATDIYGNVAYLNLSQNTVEQLNAMGNGDFESNNEENSDWFFVLIVGFLIFVAVMVRSYDSGRNLGSVSKTHDLGKNDKNPLKSQPWENIAWKDTDLIGTQPFTPDNPREMPRTDKDQIRKLIKNNPSKTVEEIVKMYVHAPAKPRVSERTLRKHVRIIHQSNRPVETPDIQQIKRLIVKSPTSNADAILSKYTHAPNHQKLGDDAFLAIIKDQIRTIEKETKHLNTFLNDLKTEELFVLANNIGLRLSPRKGDKQGLLVELKRLILTEEAVDFMDIKKRSELQPRGRKKETPLGQVPVNFPFQCSKGARKGVAGGGLICLQEHQDEILKKPFDWFGKSCPTCKKGVVEQRIEVVYFN